MPSFCGAGGEVDARACYTAMAAAHMLCLDVASFARQASMVDFLRRCQVLPPLTCPRQAFCLYFRPCFGHMTGEISYTVM